VTLASRDGWEAMSRIARSENAGTAYRLDCRSCIDPLMLGGISWDEDVNFTAPSQGK
jgi:hypothetical protein